MWYISQGFLNQTLTQISNFQGVMKRLVYVCVPEFVILICLIGDNFLVESIRYFIHTEE